MRLDLVALAVGLILILAFDGLLSAARAALMNSHPPTLRSMEARGVPGASRALQLASEATSLLISFGVGQYLARLSAVALALGGWVLWAEASASPLGGLGVVLAVGALTPLIEVLVDTLALRSPERTACTLSLAGASVVFVAAPVRSIYRRPAPASGRRRAAGRPPRGP